MGRQLRHYTLDQYLLLHYAVSIHYIDVCGWALMLEGVHMIGGREIKILEDNLLSPNRCWVGRESLVILPSLTEGQEPW